jgi:hypothetical protein
MISKHREAIVARRGELRAQAERNAALAEKRRADTETASAQAVNNFLQHDLLAQASGYGQAGPDTKPNLNLTVRTAFDRAAARVQGRFDKQPEYSDPVHRWSTFRAADKPSRT